MAGGAVAKMLAPLMAANCPETRPSTACSECSAPFRCANGFRLVKISPWFGAAPLKLKPMTENTPSTSGSLISASSACRATSPVYCSDAPGGAWTMVIRYPSSSDGTNARGTERYTHHVSPSDAAKSTTITQRRRSTRDSTDTYALVPAVIARSIVVKTTPLPWWLRPRSRADSAGVSVNALNAESATENAIVIENCAYNRPVVPGKNATGTNTAISTSAVAMTAPNTSRIASDAAFLAGLRYS